MACKRCQEMRQRLLQRFLGVNPQPTPDWGSLLLSIQRCNASYDMSYETVTEDFAKLGSKVVAWMSTDRGQAVMSRKGSTNRLTLTITGTRATMGSFKMRYEDVKADIDDPIKTVNGVGVFSGIYDELVAADIYGWALRTAAGESFDVEGHSKGAVQAIYAQLFVPKGQLGAVIAWEPPKAGDDAFWAAYDANLTVIITLRDLWAAWPWFGSQLKQRPKPFIWLQRGTWTMITEDKWPGVSLDLPQSLADHEPERIIPLLQALISKP